MELEDCCVNLIHYANSNESLLQQRINGNLFGEFPPAENELFIEMTDLKIMEEDD